MKFVEVDENRLFSDFQKKGRIRKCFYCKKDGNIISSHSISERRCLSLLTENVNGQIGIYSFKDVTWSKEHYFDAYGFGDFELVGIKKASTFKGFCSRHDQSLFKLIDETPFDSKSLEQCFLYCYRAFARNYHSKNEELKRCNSDSEYKEWNFAAVIEEGRGADLCLTLDVGNYPDLMNEWLDSRDYTHFYHFHIETKTVLPIAASSTCEPPYTINKCRINNYLDFLTPLNHIFINIIPEEDKTHILISAFSDQPKAIQFIEELEDTYKSDKDKFGRFLTSTLIFHVENTFFSPSLINSLTSFERRNLLLNLKPGIQENLYNRYLIGDLDIFKNSL